MINDIVQFSNFLKCLKEAHCLGNVILVGSWSEYLYQTFISEFTAEMATVDLDFLIPDLNQPEEKRSISEIAKHYGFEYSEKGEPAFSVFTGQDGFEVEFLSELKGDGINKKAFSNIGVKTQQLRHIHILQNFTRFVSFNKMTVRVPEPEAYCLQKMIINSDRLEQGKVTSDQKKIKNIIPYLNPSIVTIIYDALTEKEKARVNKYIKTHLNKLDIYELFNIEREHGFIATPDFESGIHDIAAMMRATKKNESKLSVALDDKEIDKLLAESTKLRGQISKAMNELLATTDDKEEAKTYIYIQLSKQGIHSPESVIDNIVESEQKKELKGGAGTLAYDVMEKNPLSLGTVVDGDDDPDPTPNIDKSDT